MKQLICEMCGGKDLVKENGVFVCQSCGCKYSVEEARKMMVEGTVEVTGTVKIDRADEKKQAIENYLAMCKSAQDSNDDEQVLRYADKVLELDINNCEAWKYKALYCGHDASISDMKVEPTITATRRALELAPEGERREFAERIYMLCRIRMIMHVTTIRSLNGTASLATAMLVANNQANMAATVANGWIRVVSEIPYLSAATMEKAIEDLKVLHKEAAFSYACGLYNGKKPYYETLQEALQNKIEEVKACDFKRYWEEHEEEKIELENRKATLEKEIVVLQVELEDFTEESEKIREIKQRIASLVDEKHALGLFKKKEKSLVQEKIDSAKNELKEEMDRKSALEKKIVDLKKNIEEINVELTKER